MDLQTRKLNVIQYLIELQDEKTFSRIEESIKETSKGELVPFTQKQLIERAKRSNDDYQYGRVKTQEQLEIDSENW